MKASFRFMAVLALVVSVGLVTTPRAMAQETTTGSISGQVTLQQDGSPLAGATVIATHVPTGTQYKTVTRDDGRYSIFNVRVGSPYEITVQKEGFRTKHQGGLRVRLGEDLKTDFTMQLQAVSETVTVTGGASAIINPSRTGATSNVSSVELQTLPTIDRSLLDYARTSPFFSTLADSGNGDTTITVAGRPNRYNNIQIDGAVNNDVFGLAAQGTPGGQAETQPISLDAIQEVQLLVSPYDVRQGGFSGGAINAITKSGTNKLKGGIFYYTRDQNLVGKTATSGPIGKFSNKQYGFHLGGPIKQDKAFYFVTAELDRRDTPAGYSVNGSGQHFGHEADVNEFLNILKNEYGYDPGGTNEFTRGTNSDNFFGRLDFNLSDSTQLTLRHNYVKASNDIGYPSARAYIFPDHFYQFHDKTNSSVAQLNSVFSNSLYNEARLTYQTIRDRRSGPTKFPQVRVYLSDGSNLTAGTEEYSTANSLDQTIVELTDDLTWWRGNHKLTFGTHNESFKFNNLFIRDNFGAYWFNTLADFAAGRAYEYSYSFSNTSNPQQAAAFNVRQYGLYAEDEWSPGHNLTVTYGLRMDMPTFPDTPGANPAVTAVFGKRTNVTPSSSPLWSPRVGFNWDIGGKGSEQLRGGLGIFTGRTPYVWLSNQYSNTGLDFTRLYANIGYRNVSPTNYLPFNPDPNNQPTSVGSASTNEVDLVDPNFQFPQIFRTTLAYDRQLPWWGMVGTVEAIYSKTRKDILYQDLNVVPTGQHLFDGRPLFTNKDRNFSNVIYLTNTNKGDQVNASIKIEKPYSHGLTWSVSYVYGKARSINDGSSSQAVSNWKYLPIQGDPNHPGLSNSDFDVRDRFMGYISYHFKLFGGLQNTVSFFYNAQSGRPYSTLFYNDVNGDRQYSDLLYVPANVNDVIVTGGTAADLQKYINADKGLRDAKGHIVQRNASFAPWTHQLDFHYSLELPIQRFDARITFDVFNFLNLLDKNWGLVRYVPFGTVSPIEYMGIDKATGKPIYHMRFSNPDQRWSIDDLRSRYQAKIGLRLSF